MKIVTLEEVLNDIRRKPVVPLWPHVGLALDISRTAVYALARRGEIDTIDVGRLKKAKTAPLRRKLEIDDA
jgi:hypothetical protein